MIENINKIVRTSRQSFRSALASICQFARASPRAALTLPVTISMRPTTALPRLLIKEIETLNAYLGTITKRPRVRGPLFFLCFLRGRRTEPNLARVPLLYVPFDFFLAFFFMTSSLLLALSPNRNNGNRQMNAA